MTRNNLGGVIQLQGRLDEAEREFQEALRQNPGFAAGLVNLGELYTKQGRHEEALPYLALGTWAQGSETGSSGSPVLCVARVSMLMRVASVGNVPHWRRVRIIGCLLPSYPNELTTPAELRKAP